MTKTEKLARRMHELHWKANGWKSGAKDQWYGIRQSERDEYLYVARGLLRDQARERRAKR